MDWDCTNNFISLSDAWFDVFNFRVLHDAKSSRNAYGTDINEQKMILSRIIHIIESVKVCGSKKMYQFQKGLIISCHSLPTLFDMLKKMMEFHFC